MKSFKHLKTSFPFTFIHVKSTYIVISIAQVDLGLDRKLHANYVTFGFPTRVPGDRIKSCEVC